MKIAKKKEDSYKCQVQHGTACFMCFRRSPPALMERLHGNQGSHSSPGKIPRTSEDVAPLPKPSSSGNGLKDGKHGSGLRYCQLKTELFEFPWTNDRRPLQQTRPGGSRAGPLWCFLGVGVLPRRLRPRYVAHCCFFFAVWKSMWLASASCHNEVLNNSAYVHNCSDSRLAVRTLVADMFRLATVHLVPSCCVAVVGEEIQRPTRQHCWSTCEAPLPIQLEVWANGQPHFTEFSNDASMSTETVTTDRRQMPTVSRVFFVVWWAACCGGCRCV